jgi:hypothetical protein
MASLRKMKARRSLRSLIDAQVGGSRTEHRKKNAAYARAVGKMQKQ